MPADKLLTVSRCRLPQNPSTQELVEGSHGGDFYEVGYFVPNNVKKRFESRRKITSNQWRNVLILFFVNLINYMDRLTIAGILEKIKADYAIGDSECGALQTAFVISYMIFAPLFGYIGDRHSRKLIMGVGVFIWAIFTLLGSFMPDYYTFLACRAMVGIGEASYSTIAPTIISDMFVKENRSKMLAFFYFAIPVGSGLGYIVGAETTNLAGGDWRWGLRVTPVLGLIAVLLILFILNDPERGESEGHAGELESSSYIDDLKGLMANRSYVLSTFAFTCVTFCTGALSWWGPVFIKSSFKSTLEADRPINLSSISLVFGVVTMLSGIVGVPLGSLLSTKLKEKYNRADPLICAVGLLVSAVLLGLGISTVRQSIYCTFIMLFFGEIALNLNWSIVADILLYVVEPNRRSTAEAIQILISHAFGDAGSPYLIGIMSDYLKESPSFENHACEGFFQEDLNVTVDCSSEVDFYSMQYSLYTNCVVEIIGGLFFLLTAVYIVGDKLLCQDRNGLPRKIPLSDEENASQLGPFIRNSK